MSDSLCTCDFCRQLAEYTHESWKKDYTFPDYVELMFGHKLTVSVCAQNPYGDLACSSEVTYSDLWNIGK